MFKHELIAKITKVLSDNDVRKPVHIDKRILKIVDATYADETTSGSITIKPKDKMVRYTNDDVANILEALIILVQDSMSRGENVAIKGLGIFSVAWRNPKRIRRPDTREWVDIPGRYVPKFTIGAPLRDAARLYTLSKQANPVGFEMPDPVYDQFEFPEDDEFEDGDELDGTES